MNEIINSFLKIRNNNEIDDLNNFLNNNKYEDIIIYKKKLEQLNNNIDEKKKCIKNNIPYDNFDILYNKISQKVEQQPWKKIPKYIQYDKIKNYVNTLEDVQDTNLYYKNIIDNIIKKKIKNSDIIYNQEDCKIDLIKII